MKPPCADDPELWFVEGSTREAKHARASAIAICRTCPLLGPCLTYTNRINPQHGVWAGRDHNHRNPRIDRLVDEILSHGTEAAYRRHLRHGEKACRACLEAAARAKTERQRA